MLWRHVCDGDTRISRHQDGVALQAPAAAYPLPVYSPSAGTGVHIQLDVSLTTNHTQSGRCRGKTPRRQECGVSRHTTLLTVDWRIRYDGKNTLNKSVLHKDATLFQLAQCCSVEGGLRSSTGWFSDPSLFTFSVLSGADFSGIF